MKILFEESIGKTMQGLQKALDLTWRRNEAITSNIANAETPQYRAVDLNFAGELNRAFGDSSGQKVMRTDAKHLDLESAEAAHLVPDFSSVTKSDGNNVDIDIQMGRLAENSGKYTAATRFLRKELAMLRYAVRSIT
jgi:flagellar basal-body rod protein FlgB